MGLVTLMMMIKSNVKGGDFIQNASGISQDGVVLCVLVLASLFSFGTSNSQGNALLELKASLKADQLTNWYPSRPNPCQWTFVGCDDEYNVISLSMISMGFSGTLSPQIGALRTLTVLELQGNNITGGIPKELRNLTSLTTLKLENNCLTGDIPSSIGNLTKLKILSLSQNNLSGNIPDSISNLQNLENIELAFNNLSGRIPDHLFQIHMYNFTGNNLNCGTNFSHPCASNASVAFIPGIPHKSKNGVVFGSIGGLISILPCGGVLFLLWKKAKKGQAFVDVSGEDVCRVELGQLKRFSWRELQLATDDFNEKNVLGQGGFGKVYRGVLADGTKIAVKQMTSNGRPNEEESFLREIEMISVANHKYLLRLIGYCTTTSERLLVYPLMKNGSVASCLRGFRPGDPVLHWCIRKQVALGTAQGLEYLHKHCNPKIIHRDVKAANILLDENFEAVVADFGLAQLVDVRKNSVTTKVRGTMGHIAPEYFSTGKSSEKTDVFGYGVMLLELVTGQRAIDFSFLEKEDDLLLLDHVKKMERVNRLDAVIDRNLDQSYDWHEVEMIIQIALLCTQSRPEERPTMSEVVCFLEGKGLAERWQEQQQVEMYRRHESETIQQRFNWHEDSCEGSMYNLEAMELSGGR